MTRGYASGTLISIKENGFKKGGSLIKTLVSGPSRGGQLFGHGYASGRGSLIRGGYTAQNAN